MSEIEQAEAALSEASLHPSGGKARGMLYRSLTALLAEHKRLLAEHTVHDALDEAWTSDARHVVELNKADRRAEAAEAERDALQARVNDALSWRDPAYEGECGRDTYAHGYRAALRRIHRILSTPKQGGRA